jgi:hypothetical protein
MACFHGSEREKDSLLLPANVVAQEVTDSSALMSWQVPPPPPLAVRISKLPIIEDLCELAWGHSLAGGTLHIKSPVLAKLASGLSPAHLHLGSCFDETFAS